MAVCLLHWIPRFATQEARGADREGWGAVRAWEGVREGGVWLQSTRHADTHPARTEQTAKMST